MENNIQIGKLMYKWITDLFPLNRSITGDGVRETLKYLQNLIPEMTLHEINTGSKCFDWEVPKEWNCYDAYILTPEGNKICDFSINNLHIVGYSIPVDRKINYEELKNHLYYLKEQPDAIPYITSYYKERWGFCLSYNNFKKLKKGIYTIKINSELKQGSLTFGEVIIKGKQKKEIFLSTYVCHPSMANNELSGPAVTTALLQFIKNITNRKYTYRVVFIPETIGSICYLNKNIDVLKQNVIAGFNITTVGDNRAYSYIPTRYGNTLSDKVSKYVLKDENFVEYSYLSRGSDERQYCAPGVDLPIATICRTKYGSYPEYHTSLDDLTVVSPEGLLGGYHKLKNAIELLERNEKYKIKVLCEPQLGKRGLYPTISTKNANVKIRNMMNFIAYADGTNDLIDIAEIINIDIAEIYEIINNLRNNNLLEVI